MHHKMLKSKMRETNTTNCEQNMFYDRGTCVLLVPIQISSQRALKYILNFAYLNDPSNVVATL